MLERKYAAARKVKPQSRALERLASAMDVVVILSFSTGVLFIVLLFVYVLTHELKT
jgi:hypothetical protein